MVYEFNKVRFGMVGLGKVWFSMVGLCEHRLGEAWLGLVRNGMEWFMNLITVRKVWVR